MGDLGDNYYAILFGTVSVKVLLEAPEKPRVFPQFAHRMAQDEGDTTLRTKRKPSAASLEAEVDRRESLISAQAETEEAFKTVVTLGPGQTFGGLSIRTERHTARMATCLAENATELLAIPPHIYREVILEHEEATLKGPVKFFRSLPLFRFLGDEEVEQMAFNAVSVRFPLGSYLARQGRPICDVRFFGILKVGRCRVFKFVRDNGAEIPVSELCQQDDATARWRKYFFDSKSAGDALAHRALMGENGTRYHSVSIIAETCVEAFFIPRNSMMFALRQNKKLEQLTATLHNYPMKKRLKDIVRQEVLWKRFQAQYIRTELNNTARGIFLLQRVLEQARQNALKKKASRRNEKCLAPTPTPRAYSEDSSPSVKSTNVPQQQVRPARNPTTSRRAKENEELCQAIKSNTEPTPRSSNAAMTSPESLSAVRRSLHKR